jgi:hypothetical protein
MRLILLLFGKGPKLVSQTEEEKRLRMFENHAVREYLEIRRKK